MNKISWFRRLFMSWDTLVKNMGLENNEDVYKKLIDELKGDKISLTDDKMRLLSQIEEYKNKLNRISAIDSQKEKMLGEKDNRIVVLEKEIEKTKATLQEKISETRKLEFDIKGKLETLDNINKKFFAATGNKGKGELGEMQVKTILEKSGLPIDFWVENLRVGNNSVEFAMKSATEGKWIPIDSKVLDAEIDPDDNKMIIDTTYLGRIKNSAKEVNKYLGKDNTAGYGVLVLQNDSILMEIYDNFPQFFKEVMDKYKIMVASPSSFVQMAWSISQIVDTYERIKGDERIYEDMISALNTVDRFAKAMHETQAKFNAAMNSHYPALVNKKDKLRKRLTTSGKIQQLANQEGDENE